VTEGWGRAE